MAVCDYCNVEMLTHPKTCTGNVAIMFPDRVSMPSIPFDDVDDLGNCGDCGVSSGGKHHPGCDVERCPRCRGQLISCGCLNEEDDD